MNDVSTQNVKVLHGVLSVYFQSFVILMLFVVEVFNLVRGFIMNIYNIGIKIPGKSEQ